jgi:hypothetical protein
MSEDSMEKRLNVVHKIRCDSFKYTAQIIPRAAKGDHHKLIITDNYGNSTTTTFRDFDEWGTIVVGGFERDYHVRFDESLEICLYGLEPSDDLRYMQVDGYDEVLCTIIDTPAGIFTEEWQDSLYSNI